MALQTIWHKVTLTSLLVILSSLFLPLHADENNSQLVNASNFGLPGIIDLPTAQRFPDGELVVTQQLHKSLARSGIAFQALPRVGVSFRYSGHGINGDDAYGRVNHDRSFDAHISILDERNRSRHLHWASRFYWHGLASEYIVGTKSIGKLKLTAGLGFGRLAGKTIF